MANAQARSPVAAPTRTPLPFGLLSVAQSAGMADAHEQLGVDFDQEPCGTAGLTFDPCPTPPADLVATSSGRTYMGATPFTVWAWDDCTAIMDFADAQGRARRALENGEARTVERVFWTGTASVSGAGSTVVLPHLAEDTAVTGAGGVGGTPGTTDQMAAQVVTTGASDMVEALGLLEGQLAWCYGNQGVVHVPRSLAPLLANSGLVKQQGSQLVTVPNGNLVALGAGYSGSGPTGAVPAGSAWIYGTGAVVSRRSEIFISDTPQAVNKAKNDLVVVAQRTYVIGYECCLVAAQVSGGGIPQGATGSAGPAT